MNAHDDLLAASLTEIDDWCATSSDATRCPSEFYDALKRLIEDARNAPQLDRNSPPFNVLLRMLTDSGPYDVALSPSLHRVIDIVTNRPSQHFGA